MPIKPENRHHYRTPEFKMSRGLTLLRARNRCEFCDAPNHKVIVREGEYWFDYDMTDSWRTQFPKDKTAYVIVTENGTRFIRKIGPNGKHKSVLVILTVAHLDHDPTNNDLDNLRALCQRCHNRHDIPHRKQTRAKTREATNAARAATSK